MSRIDPLLLRGLPLHRGSATAALFLVLSLVGAASAQPVGPPKHEQKPPPQEAPAPPLPALDAPRDTAAVAPRAVPAGALDRFRDDPAYQYERVGAVGPSLWELFWRWLDRVLFTPIAENTSPLFWRILWPVLAALVLAWVLVRVLRTGGTGLFARRGADGPGEGALLLDAEDIAEVDLDALLRQAVAEGRRRDAVRFLYLGALQALAAGGLVEWQKDKTNRDYHREVRRSAEDLARPFGEVTRLFEYVWYGEAAVDEAGFDAVQARFGRFSEALAVTTARPRKGRP